jgi:hypothetical protein
MNASIHSSQEHTEEHDPQLNAAAHNAPAEQQQVETARKGTNAQPRQNEGDEQQELQASKAEGNAGTEEADNETAQASVESDEAVHNEHGESVETMIRQELATADALLSQQGEDTEVRAASEQQNQAALAQLKGSQGAAEVRLQEPVATGNQRQANQSMNAESVDSRGDSRAEQIVDYLVDNSKSKRKADRQDGFNNAVNTDAAKAGIVGERALAENLNTTRDLLQNLISTEGSKKSRSTPSEAQTQQRAGQSVNVATTTPVENRLANTNTAVATNAAAATGLRQGGGGAGQEQKNWDGLPGQTAFQGTITGAKSNSGKQLPIAQQARNLMMQAAQALPARKSVEGRRLSLTLPMEKHGPVRMILRPGAGETHQMTFIVNSASAAAALRRILPELEETASTFPVEVADISIVTQENQPTAEDSIGFSANKTPTRSASNEVLESRL